MPPRVFSQSKKTKSSEVRTGCVNIKIGFDGAKKNGQLLADIRGGGESYTQWDPSGYIEHVLGASGDLQTVSDL